MKQSRLLLWITILLIGLVAVLRFKHTHRADPVRAAPTAVTHPSPAHPANPPPAATPLAALPSPTTATTPAATAEVTIEDGMTIDFSSGHPVVTRTSPEVDAEMREALAEMEAATEDLVITSEGIESTPPSASPTP